MADYSDPKRDEESRKRAERRELIYRGLEKMPLACFNFGEYRILRRFIENRGCSDGDISFLEGKIAEFEKNRPTHCKNCGTMLREDSDHRC